MTEETVLDIVEQVLQSPQSTQSTREYAMNALMKLSTRFTITLPRIKSIMARYRDHLDMELQQRAVEYSAIFGKHDQMRYVLGFVKPGSQYILALIASIVYSSSQTSDLLVYI